MGQGRGIGRCSEERHEGRRRGTLYRLAGEGGRPKPSQEPCDLILAPRSLDLTTQICPLTKRLAVAFSASLPYPAHSPYYYPPQPIPARPYISPVITVINPLDNHYLRRHDIYPVIYRPGCATQSQFNIPSSPLAARHQTHPEAAGYPTHISPQCVALLSESNAHTRLAAPAVPSRGLIAQPILAS